MVNAIIDENNRMMVLVGSW